MKTEKKMTQTDSKELNAKLLPGSLFNRHLFYTSSSKCIPTTYTIKKSANMRNAWDTMS